MNTSKKKQLFILHFAGGNMYSLWFMKSYLDAYFDIHFLELPGRGKRIRETLLYDFEAAVTDYYQQIKKIRNNNTQYHIYGHSLGALLGFWVSVKMEKAGDVPISLIVSGSRGPNVIKKKNRHLMSDAALKKELLEMGGVEEEVLSNNELFDFFNPIIRADFQLVDEYVRTDNDTAVSCPIRAIMGDKEELVTRINDWKMYTINNFNHTILSGGHFFIYDHKEEISRIIIN